MNNNKLLASILSASLMTVVASSQADEGRWYINPSIGIQDFDTERELDDATTFSLGGEYRFNDSWATELRILDSNPDIDGGGSADVDVNQYYLDGLYYFKPMAAKWQPFTVLGLGHADYDSRGADSTETQANAGFGLRYGMSENWSLRGDVRGLYGFDDGTWDSLINLGISYAFGGKKAAPVASVAPIDSDSDGVVDGEDRCPSTPEGAGVDSSGCPLDSDADGIADYRDQCPATPKGRKVDDNGCKILMSHIVEMNLNVSFANDSSEVQDNYLSDVEKVAQFLKTYQEVTAEISGYTDDRGAASYNKALSQRRAESVRNVLINNYGVAASRLTAKGFGEEQPVASNDTAQGRQANRRVVATMQAEVKK